MPSFSNTGRVSVSLYSGPGTVPAHGRGMAHQEQAEHPAPSLGSSPPGGFQGSPRPAVLHGEHGGEGAVWSTGRGKRRAMAEAHGPSSVGAWALRTKQGHLLMICPYHDSFFLGQI